MQNRDRAVNRTGRYDDVALMQRWHDIIIQVREEFAEINAQRRMMDLAVGVVNANPRFLSHPGRRFMDTARNWYGFAMAAAVRRQSDNDDRSASLRVVLEELRVRSSAYRLDALHSFMPRASTETVRQFVMADVCSGDSLDVGIVTSDIDALINVSRDVRRFVNQHVAHSTQNRQGSPVESPSFGEIHDVLERFETIYRRWERALTGNLAHYVPGA